MANLSSLQQRGLGLVLLLVAFQFLHISRVECYKYTVGDLNAWGIPPSTNPNVYTNWAKNHAFSMGDSLLFLYPPSQDSVIQVTLEAYRSCNLKDPILVMKDGNSLFNITSAGPFYFTSGKPGNCGKGQKLFIALGGNVAFPPSSSSADDTAAAAGPSYPTVFGSIPTAPTASPSTSSSPSLRPRFSFSFSVASIFFGWTIWAIVF